MCKSLSSCLALVVLVWFGVWLAGCAPAASPWRLAAEAGDRPTPTPIRAEALPPRVRQAVTLTVLHTNDVVGEVDPCG